MRCDQRWPMRMDRCVGTGPHPRRSALFASGSAVSVSSVAVCQTKHPGRARPASRHENLISCRRRGTFFLRSESAVRRFPTTTEGLLALAEWLEVQDADRPPTECPANQLRKRTAVFVAARVSPICQRRAMASCVPTYPGAGLTESQVGPNGEFCGHMALIRCGLFKRRSQSRLVISRSVRD
jgi:hypothetical protein